MLTLFPPMFSSPIAWSLEDHISHDQQSYANYKDTGTSESFLQVPPSEPQVDHNQYAQSTSICGDPLKVKKLNHNASERDRRKKINTLYTSLRSLLPGTDQTKKLSVPATVSRVLKYIPELQEQVEGLHQKKEELLSKLSRHGDLSHQEKQNKNAALTSCSAVSASRLNDREVIIQMTTYKSHKLSLTEILVYLEENGLLLLNASSFESFGGRVFHSLHFQVEGNYRWECKYLSEKVTSMIEKREQLFPC